MKNLKKIIHLFCLIIISNTLMASFAYAKSADVRSSELNTIFKAQPESFDQILGQWNSRLLDQKIQLNILEFSQSRVKGKINLQGKETSIDSKVLISKIAHEYKFSFKINQGKYKGHYTLFLNTQKPHAIHGYYTDSNSKEFPLNFKQ